MTNKKTLQQVKVGDVVLRILGRSVRMKFTVTEVTEDRIFCGTEGIGWTFDRATGAEVDEEIRWGPEFGRTGSFIYPLEDEACQ